MMATESIMQFIVFWSGVAVIAYLCYCLAGFVSRMLNLFSDEPDSEQTYTDDNGVKWFKYGVEYTDQRGRTMTFDIWALSFADADRHLNQIANNGRVYGQIYCQVKG
ncbi:Mu phage uncharacterized protein [Shewanella oneidensis MR-1]|uniref:Mu phage uncharacterized protein n=2 Tax=Shewanella oneidensis TaxID=70863 RepID=Q8EDT6_SHEON|nr:Mu phage uncharacterized protein [Shewanella oneidensis MR-1]